MRLAEIYLIRSEAYARKNEFEKAYADLKTIRDRVGLPQLEQKNNWSDYLTDLAKERICELGLEGHRYFDLIRWGIAVQTLNQKRLHGIKIEKKGNDFAYEKVNVTHKIVCSRKDILSSLFLLASCKLTFFANKMICGNNII